MNIYYLCQKKWYDWNWLLKPKIYNHSSFDSLKSEYLQDKEDVKKAEMANLRFFFYIQGSGDNLWDC